MGYIQGYGTLTDYLDCDVIYNFARTGALPVFELMFFQFHGLTPALGFGLNHLTFTNRGERSNAVKSALSLRCARRNRPSIAIEFQLDGR